ncbi:MULTISPECIES: hypothetical protein [Streptomyces]|uniref:DUF3040 domain-containing protein n=1 Tax=Streptomyces silvisoli TaxID=3034235 RepID=A0ABT5ZLZ5_9ACTN|nr:MULTISPECIES: hypothetical protein [Streptomyces]MDF3290812.1 hypothetical protein [Streptomyces silvisoli]
MTERQGRRDEQRAPVDPGAERFPADPAAPAPPQENGTRDTTEERRRRRALFLRELHEAKELRDRVQPRRARAARAREQMRMRTFRW